MASIERMIQDFLAPVEAVARAKAAQGWSGPGFVHSQSATPLPAWMDSLPAATAHWDWLESDHALAGLEVTEHEVPAGWFERTFGVRAAVDGPPAPSNQVMR